MVNKYNHPLESEKATERMLLYIIGCQTFTEVKNKKKYYSNFTPRKLSQKDRKSLSLISGSGWNNIRKTPEFQEYVIVIKKGIQGKKDSEEQIQINREKICNDILDRIYRGITSDIPLLTSKKKENQKRYAILKKNTSLKDFDSFNIFESNIEQFIEKHKNPKKSNNFFELNFDVSKVIEELEDLSKKNPMYLIKRDDALFEYNQIKKYLEEETYRDIIFNMFKKHCNLVLLNMNISYQESSYFDVIKSFLDGLAKRFLYSGVEYSETKKSKIEDKKIAEFKQVFQNLIKYYGYFKESTPLNNMAEWSLFDEFEDVNNTQKGQKKGSVKQK